MGDRRASAGGGWRTPVAAVPETDRLPVLGAASAFVMMETAGRLGMMPEECLGDTGLTRAAVADPGRIVRLDQEFAVARNVLRSHGHVPALGMLCADQYGVALYGSFGLGLLAAPTGRAALAFANRFADLTYTCAAVRCHEQQGELRLVVDGSHLPKDIREFLVDRALMGLIRLLGDLLPGTDWLRWVSLARPEPEHAQAYRTIVPAELHFDRELNQLAIDAAALDRPLPMANTWAYRAAEQACEREVTDRRSRVGLAETVHAYVASHMSGRPRIVDVARQLGLSERSLRRRLAVEGTSFTRVVDDARRSAAEQLLLQGATPSQVSRNVGFLEQAAFSHAFKRWHGVSPSEYARTRRGGAPTLRSVPCTGEQLRHGWRAGVDRLRQDLPA
ncbi:AraC family transcriptional regulator ligand-binding domain-containing protein [Kitasatospora sp. NPDC097643]|uniref:AraC family transcriptional regulator n=1 Tax=Kitasatospora sp. NPDC097643 TaxID=3157230 RepID=UPI00332AA7C4